LNYCFLARPSLDKFSPLVYKEIKESYDKEALGVFITTNAKETATVKSLIPDAIVYETATFLKEHWSEFFLEKLIDYEARYDCSPIWKYIYSDRFLINRDYNYVVKVAVGLFMFFESIFNKHSIDIYYSETIATLQCYVAFLVGKKIGVKYYAQMGARGLDATHHYVLDDPFQGILSLDQDYQNIKYSEDEIRKADEFLSNFESREIKPGYMLVNGQKPKLKLKYAILPVLRFLKRFDSNYSSQYSYMYYQSYKNYTDPIKFYFQYQKCKKYYHQADYTRKFVYFPLHYQPEASTIVCALKYEKQLYFIDSWAKSLPADTVLYVKEHYAILGHRDPQFYKELKKYPNVVLIDPWESSRKLIQNSVAITTLTGTAGWEAMLLRKPVFIGGNIFFDNAPGVIKVIEVFDNYLNEITTWKQPTRNELLKYLCAYLKAIAPGCAYGTKNSTSDSNIRFITDSLMKHILSTSR